MAPTPRPIYFRTIIFSCLFVLVSFITNGQGCDCPALSTCGTCIGGLTGLTLKYNGAASALITVSDQIGDVFSEVVNPGGTFVCDGSLPNEKFAGLLIEIEVDGILHTTIATTCGTTFAGSIFGDFTVIAGSSLNGGALCCSAPAMETIPPVISNCPPNMIVSLPSSSCSMTVSWSPPSATDNCEMESLTSVPAMGSIFPIGSTEVTYTALDVFGNTSTCSFTILVEDHTPPVFTTCPSDITAPANGTCQAVVSWTAPLASR